MPDTSPAKWHLAHTTWFFENFVLARAETDHRPLHPLYSFLFNSYYESVGERHARPRRGLLSRPTVDEVYAYRADVDRRMRAILKRPDTLRELAPVIELGMQHEQQHQELILTDLKHALAHNPLQPAYHDRAAFLGRAPKLGWLPVRGGLCEVGHKGVGFAFDNELPRHRVHVEPFVIANRPATAGEFIAFIEDDGYLKPDLWLSDGWDVVRGQGWKAPLYWTREASGWNVFTLSGKRDVALDEPVSHLSFYEADAFARWAGARLPTEAEWELAADGVPVVGNFLDSGTFHPSAPQERANADRESPLQMFGDVWEWTSSAYGPYPGFRPLAGALGEYNGKFMSGQLVLRGGSCATPRSHIRATYRNFFRPGDRWQFSGIRLARDC
jgi:ergothioneine biosynthesis protein EgtB